MEMHTDDECQKYWRDVFAHQLEEAHNVHWPQETDTDAERSKWFREGIRYAMMIIRWDYTE